MKYPLKAPNDYGPVEDLAFTMYAVDIEESRRRINKAIEHLEEYPEDFEEIPWIYNLTEEEWDAVKEGVANYEL